MFYSYHKNIDVAKKFLATLPQVKDTSSIPPAPEIDRFDFETKTYTDIRNLVNKYFVDNNLSSRGGLYMISKSVLLIALFFFVYSITLSGWTIFCPLLGVLAASLGLCVQHDANHGALSSSPIVNRIFGFCDDIIGGSGLMWRHQVSSLSLSLSLFVLKELTHLLPHQHDIGHHVFCNDVQNDNDTKSQYPLMRMNPGLPYRSYLQYQHIYGPAVYSLLGVSYPIGDTTNYLSGAYADIPLHELSTVDRAIFIFGKCLHFVLFFLLPFYTFGLPFLWKWYLPTLLVGGLWLASVFAVSHNNSKCVHNCSSTDWALMQVHCLTHSLGHRHICTHSPTYSFLTFRSRHLPIGHPIL